MFRAEDTARTPRLMLVSTCVCFLFTSFVTSLIVKMIKAQSGFDVSRFQKPYILGLSRVEERFWVVDLQQSSIEETDSEPECKIINFPGQRHLVQVLAAHQKIVISQTRGQGSGSLRRDFQQLLDLFITLVMSVPRHCAISQKENESIPFLLSYQSLMQTKVLIYPTFVIIIFQLIQEFLVQLVLSISLLPFMSWFLSFMPVLKFYCTFCFNLS